ncbi:hypothetical protein Scep_021871 [Stephania cephalantha]|uniref:Uncharacterized protein n=1 Tax=Stephania cephalantha TaxID=152367 RepID=A0AAP0I0J8_9MAGN
MSRDSSRYACRRGTEVESDKGISSSSLQTHFVDPKRQDLRHRTVAEDPSPPPSPSSSTAIVDVDRDSPAQSFIRDRESPRSLIHLCPIDHESATHCMRYSPLIQSNCLDFST